MFGTEVRLQTVDKGLGVSTGSSSGEIIITTDNGVTVYDLTLMKSTHSWCVARDRSLESKTVLVNQQYYGILNDNVLVAWVLDDGRIGKENQCKQLPAPALALAPGSAEPFVLYANGNLSKFSEPSNYIWENLQEHCKILCFAFYASETENGTHVAFISEDSASRHTYNHVFVGPNDDRKVELRHSCNLERSVRPSRIKLYESNGEIHNVVAWEDGSMSFGNLNADIRWSEVTGFSTETGLKKPFQLAVIKEHILLFYGDGTRLVCCCFSKLLGMVVLRRSFECISEVGVIDVLVVGRGIVFLAGSTFTFLPFGEPKTLASLIGIKKDEGSRSEHAKRKLKWTSKGLKVGRDKQEEIPVKQEEIIRELCGKSDYVTAVTKLRRLKVVSETLLVDILSAYLPKTGWNDFASLRAQDKVIDEIICIKIDHVFVVENLDKLCVNQVLYLLAYLHQRFRTNLATEGEAKHEAVVDWITAVVDSHFSRLMTVVDPQMLELFRELNTYVGDRCSSTQNEIQLMRDIAVNEEQLRENKWGKLGAIPDYDIHVLVF